jgi:hypothetical protein
MPGTIDMRFLEHEPAAGPKDEPKVQPVSPEHNRIVVRRRGDSAGEFAHTAAGLSRRCRFDASATVEQRSVHRSGRA